LAQSGSKNKKFLRPIQMGQDAWESRNWPAILRSEPLALFRTKICLEQAFAGKGVARMRFQIALEGEGFVFPFEGTVKLDLPRSKLRGVWTASLVVGR
jgi:hypothetical protein